MADLRHPVLDAIAPVVDVVGGEIVEAAAMQDGDVPVMWEGEVIAGFRHRGTR